MPYSYADDNNAGVLLGAEQVRFARIIQRPDAYGGYNTHWGIGTNSPLAYFHIHFGPGGCAVRIIRYFPMNGPQGTNIVDYRQGQAKSASGLLYEAQGYGTAYPNFKKLFENLRDAINLLPKNARQEIA